MLWLTMICLLLAPADEPIEVDEALVTLIEQVEVPAREAGVLAAIDVREGQVVAVGDALAISTTPKRNSRRSGPKSSSTSPGPRPKMTSTCASPRNRPK